MTIEDSSPTISKRSPSVGASAKPFLLKAMEGILHASPDPIFIVDRQGHYLAVGEAGARALGMPASEMLGKAAHKFALAPEIAADLAAQTEQVFRTKQPLTGTTLISTLLGLRLYEHTFSPLLDDQGEVMAMLCMAKDITDRNPSGAEPTQHKNTLAAQWKTETVEAVLRASEARFQAMADVLPQLAWTAHANGFIYWYNRRWYEYTGTTLQEMAGWGWQSVHDPEILPEVLERWKASIATGESFEMVFPLRGADGQFHPFLTRVEPLKDAQGRVTQWFGTNTDVDKLKRTEDALRAAYDTFRHLVDYSPFGIYAVDADFRLVQVSVGAQKVFESVRPLLGRDFVEVLRILWTEPFASEAIAIFRHTLETGEPFHMPSTIECRQDIGTVEAYDWKVERVTLPDGRFGAVCHFYDLSERQRYEAAQKQAEEKLRLAHDKLQSVLESIRDGLAVLDKNWRYIYCNKQGAHILGMRQEQLLGNNIWELFPHAHGTKFYEGYHRAVMSGQPVRFEEFYPAPLNIWLECHCYPSDEGLSVYFHDITERIRQQQEITDLNARLQRAVAETHHRIKNNLQMLSALVEIQLSDADELIPASSLERVRQHICTLAVLHDLLTFESKVTADQDSVSLKTALAKLVPLLQAVADGRSIRVQSDEINVTLKQGSSFVLLVNELVSNALKHGKGAVEVTLSRSEATGEAQVVRLAVCDDGPGFPPDFDPKKAANTGLELIESMGRWDLRGQIAYENRAEGGGRVTVTFPLPAAS